MENTWTEIYWEGKELTMKAELAIAIAPYTLKTCLYSFCAGKPR